MSPSFLKRMSSPANLAVASCLICIFLACDLLAQVAGPSLTKEQAEIGHGLYGKTCVPCHGAELEGGAAPALKGPYFSATWGGRTVGDLFLKISTTMPLSAPGSLDRDSYGALTAYILMSNGVAATDKKLSTDPNELGGLIIPTGAE
jgi:mono/diheme cytochrome c family protein